MAKIKDSIQQQWWWGATISNVILARASMVAALAMDINDKAARQREQRGRHNNQIKATVVTIAFDCNGIGSEDGARLRWQWMTTGRKKQSISKQ